jgi:cell wall-associated NlpC family hydrolase
MPLQLAPQPNDSVWNLQLRSQIADPNSHTNNPNSMQNILDRRNLGNNYAQTTPDYTNQNDAIGRRLDTINAQGDQQNAFQQQQSTNTQNAQQAATAATGAQTYNAAIQNAQNARQGYQNQYSGQGAVGIGTGGGNAGLAANSPQAWNTSTDPTRNSVVNSASKQAGVPYQYGGSSTAGFDCSGLVQYVYKGMGIALPRTSSQQATMGTRTSISNLKPGDLVAWGSSPQTATHIAIYAGGGKIWEAQHSGTAVQTRAINANEAGIMGISLNI